MNSQILKIDLSEVCEESVSKRRKKHSKCLGITDYWGEFDCGYATKLDCEDCKYGLGRKDPEAKCNQI